ncbi:MAG: DegT/DnrJ/EryC1/StrS family aminotransferase [Deltaproteobacteria bacterium]|nr:DegT/DnrJ/EryC1/StrS family aminotransferase [Deltaproteobacteria bacterium]
MRIPFGAVTITEKSKSLILEALDSNRVSSGRLVREFEKRFAELVGAKEAVAVSTGTDADALALAVLYDFGAKRGDEVIVPSLSFVATGNAVLQAGFQPVFADIDRKTLNIDPEGIEERITEKTRAIMPVHLMGKPAEMDSIMRIARKYHLYVVEDAAEAHGGVYKGRNVGTLGDMAAYSTYVAHIITTIEGGMVVTDRTDFAEILRSLRSHGRACKCESCVLNISSGYCNKRFQSGDGIDIRFKFERIGFSSKMNELEAAVGLGNLEIFDEILEKKRKNLLKMIEKFKRFDEYLYTISEAPYEKIGPHAFPIIVQEDAPFHRNQLVDFMERKGIDTRNLFLSMPTQCPGFGFLNHRLGDFPNAEYIGDHGLHIGVHQDIGEEEIEYIMNTVEEYLEKHT